jgi:hypothetical protein
LVEVRSQKGESVKLNFKSLFLGCFVLLVMFAGAARAQEAQDDEGTSVDPKLQKMLEDFKTAKPAGGDASVERASQQQVKGEGVTSEADACHAHSRPAAVIPTCSFVSP